MQLKFDCKNGELFLMNWFCYAIYGGRSKPICYVAEQEDVTEVEMLRMKERLLVNPNDPDALSFSVIREWKAGQTAGRAETPRS